MSLIVPGFAGSKVYEGSVQFEASYLVGPDHEDLLLRVRMEDGRWLPRETWLRRLRALGVSIHADVKSVRPGPHPVGQ